MGIIIGIYKITSPSGRIYIGQSKNIKNRWKTYIKLNTSCKKQTALYNSFLKHGVDRHTFEIIEECEFNQLNIRERYWQDFYSVLNGGLNCVLTETELLPRVFSKETIDLLKKSKIGANNPNYGKFGKEHTSFGIRGRNSKSIKVLDEVTGKVYLSVNQASEELNIPDLKGQLNGALINKTTLVYFDVNLRKVRKDNKRKKVIDTKTNKVYNSIIEASKDKGIHKDTLKDWLNGRYKNKSTLQYYEN